jgi:hypothetical protein
MPEGIVTFVLWAITAFCLVLYAGLYGIPPLRGKEPWPPHPGDFLITHIAMPTYVAGVLGLLLSAAGLLP